MGSVYNTIEISITIGIRGFILFKKGIVYMLRRIAPYFGIFGVCGFTLCFLLNGWLRADSYDWLHNYVSDLSYFPYGWIQIINFFMIGACMFVFALGVLREQISTAGSVLLLIIAAFYFLSGPFVTDPMNTPLDEKTLHGIVHGILGAVVFSLSPIASLVFGLRFRKTEGYKKLGVRSYAASGVMFLAIVFMKISQAPESRLYPMAGLIQRCALLTFYAWIVAFALTIRKNYVNKVI